MKEEGYFRPYERLRDRDLRTEGFLIGEGAFVVERMLSSGLDVLSVLCAPSRSSHFRALAGGRVPVLEVSDERLGEIAGFRFHRGVMAAARRPEIPAVGGAVFGERTLLVACPRVAEQENLGSITRSCAAFGADGLLIGNGTADPFSRKAIRASMGTVLRLPLYWMDGEEEAAAGLERDGFIIAGAVSEGEAMPPGELSTRIFAGRSPDRVCLVLGNEAEGITEPWASRCTLRVRIPMREGIDSLNVGVAAGILLYELSGRGSAFHK